MSERLTEEQAAQELADLWKLHRRSCLELAIRLGASSAEQVIEMAEKLDVYIRVGRQDAPESRSCDGAKRPT
jgi:hypothetical protein